MGLFDKLRDKQAHPLSHPQAADVWWKAIEQRDAATILDTVRDTLAQFLGAKPKLSASRMAALIQLDGLAYPTFEMVCLQYVQNPRMPQQLEVELWTRAVRYCETMLKAYLVFVKDSSSSNEESSPQMALLLARSLRYLGTINRFHYFHNQSPDKKIWATANQLYSLAEVEKRESDVIRLYPNAMRAETSCADEYIRLVMLGTVVGCGLTVRQLDTVDTWLALLSQHVVLEHLPTTTSGQYWVDLTGYTGAARYKGEPRVPRGRYWSMSEWLYALMNARQHRARQSAALLESLAGTGAADLIRQLERWWSAEFDLQALRTSERVAVTGEMQVLIGLDAIARGLPPPEHEQLEADRGIGDREMMDMQQYGFITERTKQATAKEGKVATGVVSDAVHWIMTDRSERGLGLLADALARPVQSGVLLGMSLDGRSWEIGIVRRVMTQQGDNRQRIGTELLGTRAEPLIVRGGVALAPSARGQAGLVISSGDNQVADQLALIVPYSAYCQGAELTAEIAQRQVRFRMRETLIKGDHWLMAAADRLG
ncbi:hypothetical protein [Chitinivorax sp. B]|uniref:hypothetical protein n=1 Tax=Chitinivorax sp. B TaxID=2502235 RepID=UPI0010F88B8A|nr:hypothetical protein [Chitinivorax sp. B]